MRRQVWCVRLFAFSVCLAPQKDHAGDQFFLRSFITSVDIIRRLHVFKNIYRGDDMNNNERDLMLPMLVSHVSEVSHFATSERYHLVFTVLFALSYYDTISNKSWCKENSGYVNGINVSLTFLLYAYVLLKGFSLFCSSDTRKKARDCFESISPAPLIYLCVYWCADQGQDYNKMTLSAYKQTTALGVAFVSLHAIFLSNLIAHRANTQQTIVRYRKNSTAAWFGYLFSIIIGKLPAPVEAQLLLCLAVVTIIIGHMKAYNDFLLSQQTPNLNVDYAGSEYTSNPTLLYAQMHQDAAADPQGEGLPVATPVSEGASTTSEYQQVGEMPVAVLAEEDARATLGN